jgi:hypothetical protein
MWGMSIITEIADRLRLTSPTARTAREAKRAAEAEIARLEQRLARVNAVNESVIFDPTNYLDPMERYRDGDRYYLPTGHLNDRRAGRMLPILQTEEDLRTLRGMSRMLCDTNYMAIGMRDRVTEFTVGDGFIWTASNRDKRGSVKTPGSKPDPLTAKVQAVLDEWREINSWSGGPWSADPTNPTDDIGLLQDRETEAMTRLTTDGEVGVRFFEGPNGLPEIRWIEPEQVRMPPGETMDGPYSWGIECEPDDVEQRKNFYLSNNQEQDNADGEHVPAWQIVWLTNNVPATVKRGIPDFAPLIHDIDKVQKLLSGMAEVSAILAQIAYLRQHAPGVTAQQVSSMITSNADRMAPRNRGTSNGYETIPERYLEPGTIHDISNGMEYVPAPTIAGADAFIKVEQAILRAAGARWGMPEFFSGDASNNNYASIAVTGSPFDRAVKRRQKRMALFHKAIASKVLAFAVQSGRLTADEVRAVEIKVEFPSVATTDPEKETRRLEILNRAKVLSPQTWAAKEGLDSEQELSNLQAFDEAMPDAGGMGDMFAGMGDEQPAADQPAEGEAAA